MGASNGHDGQASSEWKTGMTRRRTPLLLGFHQPLAGSHAVEERFELSDPPLWRVVLLSSAGRAPRATGPGDDARGLRQTSMLQPFRWRGGTRSGLRRYA